MTIEEQFKEYIDNQTKEENKNFVRGLELLFKMASTTSRTIKMSNGTIYELITDILETAE